MSAGRLLPAGCFRTAVLRGLVLGWLAAAAVPAARAYVLEGESWPLGTPVVLNLQLGTPSAALSDGSTTWDQVAAAAADVWNPFLGNGVQLQVNYDTFAPQPKDGKNTVFFSDTVYGDSFGEDTLAVTLLASNQTVTTETDVIVNSAQSFDSYRGALRTVRRNYVYDLRRVLIHEFGHVLGLDHTPQTMQSIMAPVITDFDTVQADDVAGVAALYVNPQYNLPTIVHSLTATGSPGQAFQYQVAANGPSIRYAATGLPPGLGIDPATGFISGTPTAAGVFVVQLTVSNPHGSASATLTITLQPPPVITSPTNVTAIVGLPFYYQVTATNNPTSFDFDSNLASFYGLSTDRGAGLISGVPNYPTQLTFSLSASNAVATGRATLALNIVYDSGPYTLRTVASTEGIRDYSVLTLGSDGNFYGTALNGGAANAGSIFRLTPSGDLTVLHSFPAFSSPAPGVFTNDGGRNPDDGVIEGRDGNFYGLTSLGGPNTTGTFFRLTPAGELTTLYNLASDSGGWKTNPLVQGSDGNFYGTLTSNIAGYFPNATYATIFRFTPDGSYTLLHAFKLSASSQQDDGSPSGLVQANDGNFYGVCSQGAANGLGTIFRISPAGDYQTVYTFAEAGGLGYPSGAPVPAADGSLYGTFGRAGSPSGFYRYTMDGTLTVLSTMPAAAGAVPSALAMDTDGSLYGIGSLPNPSGAPSRVLGRYALDGTLVAVLHTFTVAEGVPQGPMTRAADGSFYGVTANNNVLRIVPGLVLPNRMYVSVVPKTPYAHPAPGPAGVFTLRRDSGDLASALTVNLSYDGTARAGVDYATLPVAVTIPAGAASVDCQVVGLNPALGGTRAALNVHVAAGDGYTVNPNARDTQLQVDGNASAGPPFFAGEVPLSNGVYYLSFSTGNPFGYYAYLSDPRYIYHFDLGYEYWIDAADGRNGVYFYDFKSSDWFYTSPAFPFPYLYDFGLGTTLYYYPDPKNAGRYNTNGVRYFYNFATGQIITR